jgi:putative ABC transport system permease protein
VALAGAGSLTVLTTAVDGQAAIGAAIGLLYLFVLAVALLAPWINRAAARLTAPVLRAVWRQSGYLATRNLRANARGMTTVLTALVLSVGFGGSVWFLQDNLQRQTVAQSRAGLVADRVLTAPAGLPAGTAEQVRRVPGVAAATGVRQTSVLVKFLDSAEPFAALGVDPDGLAATLDLKVTRGSLAGLDQSGVAVSAQQAATFGWQVGEQVRFWLGDGTPASLRVVAVYDRGLGFGDLVLDRRTLAGHTATGLDDRVLVRAEPGADIDAGLAALAQRHPGGTVLDPGAVTGQLAGDLALSAWLNKLLIAVMVGYAALAAANTMVLAALARRRELALLRLVGVTRRQVKRMVHAEQVGLLGTALLIGAAIAGITLASVVNALTGQPLPYVPALGVAAVLGGTALLALTTTVLPVGRLLRIPPVESIGIKE